MGLIGIDSHKDTLACAQVDEAGRLVRFDDIANTTEGHQQFLDWIRREAIDTVAIEGSGNYGRPLAKQLAAAGLAVREVPPQMTAAARKGTRTGSKTDRIDAVLVAQIALRHDDLPTPRPAGPVEDLRRLVQYRRELVEERNRHINRLHSDLEQIRVGYQHKIASRIGSEKSLKRCRQLIAKDTSIPARIARRRITTILALGRDIKALRAEIDQAVTASGTTLVDIDGVGTIVAAEILTEVADFGRFPTKSKFAMANGTAPLEASSGRVKRHRLNRGGNRQLNKAIHVIAIAQIARATTDGRRYYDKKLAEGKTKREAIRALKRRISDRVWTHLQHTDPIISLT